MHLQTPAFKEVVNRLLASRIKSIIINYDIAFVHDIIVQGFEANLCGLVPIAIDSQNSDRTYAVAVQG